MATVVLLWRDLGFKLSWSKGAYHKKVDWIGIHFEVDQANKRVFATISKQKIDDAIDNLQAMGMADKLHRDEIGREVGLIEWMAGLFRQLKQFASISWATLGVRGADRHHVWRRQIDIASERQLGIRNV